MSFLASTLDRLFPKLWTRTGSFACTCGAVQVQLDTPPSSFVLVEQTSALCHCRDCVGFCQALSNNKVIQNDATHLLGFYKSDVKVVKGQDAIASVKLYTWSPFVRCYCKHCLTPLGVELVDGAPGAPVVLLYAALIQAPYPIFLPSLVLNYASRQETTRPYAGHVTVRNGWFAPLFYVRIVSRVLVGWILGKGTGGLLHNDYSKVTIGIDSLPKKSQ